MEFQPFQDESQLDSIAAPFEHVQPDSHVSVTKENTGVQVTESTTNSYKALQEIASNDNTSELSLSCTNNTTGLRCTIDSSDDKNAIDEVFFPKSVSKIPVKHCWETLDPALQSILPNEQDIPYVDTEFTALQKSQFSGAPDYAFEATVRINLKTKDAAEEWLKKMMQYSVCMYRHTRGKAPRLKRVLYKVDMHCQHHKKQLTPKQQHKSNLGSC